MKFFRNQKGQVLLFVIVTMTIAMAVGVAIATRTLASLSRTSRSDTSNKALAAAESGIEHFLAMDFDSLATYVDAPEPTKLEFYDEVSGITTTADVTVSSFTNNSPTGSTYDFNLGEGFVKEVTFKSSSISGNINVCWDNTNTALRYVVYNQDGITSKGLVNPSSNPGLDTSNADTADSSGTYAGGCRTIGISSDTYGVRLHSLYEDANFSVSSTSELPVQGYKITSIGKLLQEGKVITTKKITVYKSKPYLPSVFDTAVYTEQDFN